MKTSEVRALADIRRQSAELVRAARALTPAGKSPPPELEDIRREAEGAMTRGEGNAVRELSDHERAWRERVVSFSIASPRYAAYLLAHIAKLKQMIGGPFDSELAEAKAVLARAKSSPTTPSDLLANAVILGIARRAAAGKRVSAAELARMVAGNETLLRDSALILAEAERASFLGALPKETHAVYSARMDRELASVLKGNTEGERGTEQGRSATARAESALEEALEMPRKDMLGVVKLLSQTLADLDEADVKRLLARLGAEGLKSAENAQKERWKISQVARIVKTLADIDVNKGGMLTMRFLAKAAVPERIFVFFCAKLVQAGYLTSKLMPHLGDKKALPVLRRLVREHPSQFNTIIDTVSSPAVKNFDIVNDEGVLFQALTELDAITPIIFNRYRTSDPAARSELARKLKEVRPKFFRNMPISDILDRKDRDILAEMVYLAYKPVNMSFEKVQALMRNLEDRTGDIGGYRFPAEGYDFALASGKTATLKRGESLDLSRLRAHKQLFSATYPEGEEATKKFGELLVGFAKGGALNPKDERSYHEGLSTVLGILNRDEMVQRFVQSFPSVSEANGYEYATQLEELWNIYFRDNYADRLKNFLGANPTVEGQLAKILTNPPRQEMFKKRLGPAAEQIAWNKLADKGEISKLLTLYINASMLGAVRADINKTLKKFKLEGAASGASVGNLKAYVSKNIGSFFAKASAGICTSEDIPLWKDEEHFHINIVENDEYVRANVQAYVVDIGRKKALLLRGFNPNSDFLKRIDAGAFCDKMLEVARQFATDNQFSSVYISEQGGWHALSNREQIGSYLVKKYHRVDNRVSYSRKVASSHSISDIYKV